MDNLMINKRGGIIGKLTVVLFVILLFCKSTEINDTFLNKGGEVGQEAPNIVFILADDLGGHDLSGNGSNYYETPNIDRMAREGTVFSKGYASSRVCSP